MNVLEYNWCKLFLLKLKLKSSTNSAIKTMPRGFIERKSSPITQNPIQGLAYVAKVLLPKEIDRMEAGSQWKGGKELTQLTSDQLCEILQPEV
jgi:hypothetical protein